MYMDGQESSKMSRIRVYMESQIEKDLYKKQPERSQELLLDIDKPLITLYMAQGYVDG